jgi:hypothetical protein
MIDRKVGIARCRKDQERGVVFGVRKKDYFRYSGLNSLYVDKLYIGGHSN